MRVYLAGDGWILGAGIKLGDSVDNTFISPYRVISLGGGGKNGQENVCYSGIKMSGMTEGQDDQGPRRTKLFRTWMFIELFPHCNYSSIFSFFYRHAVDDD